MAVDEVGIALEKFGDAVVAKSKRRLSKKSASGKLEKSIDYELETSKNSFSLSFEMEDYGEFIDQGVKGVGGVKADGSRWKLKRVTGSKFKYKNKRPPSKVFDQWSIRRGIAGRNSKGQFIKRTSINFALANSVFHTGLETTHFFTKPFEDEFKKLPEDLIEAYELDVEQFLENSIKENRT